MTDTTHPEALRSIQRFEVVDCIDDKHVPAVIPKPHGPWVRYEDHIAALAAGQATAAQPGDIGRKSIDMVLHCPKCGLQHIDKDNYEELRIEAAELGVDREGDRELERWIEEREWTNPPHRSHLCASCKHIWRPADVCTNGVLAVKTKGQEDDPIEEVATRIYGGGRGGGKANKELRQLINEVHREDID